MEKITLDEFLAKYNRCPFCRFYTIQGSSCDNCQWRWAYGRYKKYRKETDLDKFSPTPEWGELMQKEVEM